MKGDRLVSPWWWAWYGICVAFAALSCGFAVADGNRSGSIGWGVAALLWILLAVMDWTSKTWKRLYEDRP